MHCILTTADATQTHKLRSVSELRSGKTKKKKRANNSRFCLRASFRRATKELRIAHNLLVDFFSVCSRTAAVIGRCFLPLTSQHVSRSSLTLTGGKTQKKNHNSLQLFFAQTQNKKKKTIFTLTISIAHRNSILIFIFRSVLCCQWNWQYRALQHARTLSEISVHTVFVSPSLIN